MTETPSVKAPQEEHDSAYSEGSRAAWRHILSEAIRQLGIGTAEGWRLERADVVNVLRRICEHHGDNDWSDDLHLGDVISNHLEKHLER